MTYPLHRACKACLQTTPCFHADHALPPWRLRLACKQATQFLLTD
ncbi:MULTISPECIES: hypothetical protein [Bacteroides]|nr:hypothetical protein [Bacteroides nordii]